MERKTPYNSTFAICGVSFSADSFGVAECFVFRLKISVEIPAHRKSANVIDYLRTTVIK